VRLLVNGLTISLSSHSPSSFDPIASRETLRNAERILPGRLPAQHDPPEEFCTLE
jgi:hypothetical protein